MTTFQSNQAIDKVKALLKEAGLQDHVIVQADLILNEYDKMTPV